MKLIFNFLGLIGLFSLLSSCIQDKAIDPYQEIQGDKYDGVIVFNTEQLDSNGNLFLEFSDEYLFSFWMDDDRYYANPSVEGNCNGELITKSDSISFVENNLCRCWCDCNPLLDCGGLLLWGDWKYEFKGDSLFLFREYDVQPNPYAEISFPDHVFNRITVKGSFAKVPD